MNRTLGGDRDDALQALMSDIVKGVRAKLVEPVLNENRNLAALLAELHKKDQQEFEEIKARMDRLEEAVRATPLLLLAAIKEAINRVGTDDQA
ncbi:MAG: hypothetical protein ACOY40_16420 [Bacillota bacterium]